METFRSSLINSNEIIEVTDLGAGSKKVNSKKRKVADVTRYSTSSRKVAQLLQYFCTLTPSENNIELGTCVGISAGYLGAVTKGILNTFEGAKELTRIAQTQPLNPNINFISGEISKTLPEFLATQTAVDFGFIDANHTYEGTMESFLLLLNKTHPKSILIIGDIHWSKEMELAWGEIIRYPEVKLSLDFYEVGVLFFDFSASKDHYILDF